VTFFCRSEYRGSVKQFNMRNVRPTVLSHQRLASRLIAAAVFFVAPGPFGPGVQAEGRFGGSMGGTSDYIAYGLSQTRGEPAIQADLHYRAMARDNESGYFVGLWASSLNSTYWEDSSFELDIYAGGMWRIGPRSNLTLSLMHYAYPGSSFRPRYDYDELAATWSYSDRWSATVSWSPDTLHYTHSATARCCRIVSYEFQGRQPLQLGGVTLSAGVGYADLADTAGYGFWNAGISRMLGPVQLDVSYFGTDSHAERLFSENVAGSRWAASALWRFGGS
jgi:uncharacterized protein (TIGR02001 family)